MNKKYLTVNYFHYALNDAYTEAMSILDNDPEQPYNIVVIDSAGGHVICLNHLLDLFQGCKKPVITIATSLCASCGLGLFTSANIRIASPRCMFLLHQVSGGSIGKTSDILSDTKHIEELNDEIAYKLYDKAGNHPEGFTKNLVKENFNADIYLSANEMKNYNWCDYIMPMNVALDNIDDIYQEYVSKQKIINPIIKY